MILRAHARIGWKTHESRPSIVSIPDKKHLTVAPDIDPGERNGVFLFDLTRLRKLFLIDEARMPGFSKILKKVLNFTS